MIQKNFVCDLCELRVFEPTPAGERPACRLAYTASGSFILRPLVDGDASEKIICGRCLNTLKTILTGG